MNNFNVIGCDTDSILFCKSNQTIFTKQEQEIYLKELNSLYPENIKFDHDGFFPTVIILKSKNYILQHENGKLTIKGSALKASTKSKKLKQFIKDVIDCILNEKMNYIELYNTYAKEINNIQDIASWCVRKTITDKVLKSERKNETNLKDAIEQTNLREGDRCFVFYRENGTLCLSDNFNGDYNKNRLYQNLFDTMKIFDTILNLNELKNYKLKKNKKDLVYL